MLKEIKIKNFKCLKDTGKLEIKPLTFLVGPNSSGKTSLFQFLLALRQTSQCHDYDCPLILQDYIDLGSYKDIIFGHNENNELEIDLSFEKKGKEKVTLEYSFIFNLVKFKKGETRSNKISLKKFSYVGPFYFIELLKKEKKDITKDIIINERKFKKAHIEIIKKGRNNKYVLKFLSPEELHDKEIECNIGHFFRLMAIKGKFFPIPFFSISDEIDKFLTTLFHIGPLREEPQRVYTGAGIVPRDVGKTGKWAVDALLIEPDSQKKAKYWLEKFSIASDILVKELRKGSKRYEVILRDIHTGVDVNLTDVGFGASQVLPIIIESIIVPEKSTILLEQPEIHLHPKAQTIMGEMLVDFVTNNKIHFIVETHSDLILSKVCTLVAKGEISTDDIIIYYFNPSQSGTNIIRININEYGQFENFPEGFFEERYYEAMERADVLSERK